MDRARGPEPPARSAHGAQRDGDGSWTRCRPGGRRCHCHRAQARVVGLELGVAGAVGRPVERLGAAVVGAGPREEDDGQHQHGRQLTERPDDAAGDALVGEGSTPHPDGGWEGHHQRAASMIATPKNGGTAQLEHPAGVAEGPRPRVLPDDRPEEQQSGDDEVGEHDLVPDRVAHQRVEQRREVDAVQAGDEQRHREQRCGDEAGEPAVQRPAGPGAPAAPRPRGRVRRARVTGAARSSSGVISDRTMCWVMWTLNSTML